MVVWNLNVGQLLSNLLAHHLVLSIAVIVSLQALLITIFATLLARFCRRDPQWSHRIWLSAVTLLLVIIPAHLFQGGWPVGIVQTAPVDTTSGSVGSGRDLIASRTQSIVNEVGVLSAGEFSKPRILAIDELRDYEVGEATQGSESLSSQPFARNTTVAVAANSSHQTASAVNFGLGYSLLGCYLFGIAVCLARLLRGMWRLRGLVQTGTALNDSSLATFQQAAQRVGLHVTPTVRLAEGISMPLTCGVLHSMVLLPSDFESWPPADQHAVAMHELMHIKRRDVLCEFLARVMRTFYWFHPVGAYLARQLTLTRELATDQCVVACGEEPHRYAKSVVDILTRLNLHTHQLTLPALPVIAMSAMGNLEVRLQSILDRSSPRFPLFRGRLLIALLLAIAALTTLRIELVTAQTGLRSPVATDSKANDSKLAPASNNPTAAKAVQPATPSTDNDLISRIRTCEVLTVTGDDYDAEFDVSGQVLSASGQPVAGATVLLRESSTSRISAEHAKYIDVPQRHLVRVNDVFARTISDRDGRFHFDGVKAPALPRQWRNAWRGDVVAGHPQLGVGWVSLKSKRERHRVETGLTIVLRPTATIAGNYISPAGDPLADAMVCVYRCAPLAVNRMGLNDNDLDLQLSQLTPRVPADSAGRFSISGMPQGLIAWVAGADHAQWLGNGAVTATSDGVPLGRQEHSSIYGREDLEIVPSPVTLVADPGVKIVGTVVDDHGLAIEGANVSVGSMVASFFSDHQGNFIMHLRSEFAKSSAGRDGGPVKLLIRSPKGSDLLTRFEVIPIEEFLSGKSFRLPLQRGVRVTGRVVASDGQPLPEICVSQRTEREAASSRAFTDAAGSYELVVAPGQHTLVVGTDRPGYRLPTTWAAVYGKDAGKPAMPQIAVDVMEGTPIELEPFVVERTGVVQVSVALPGGQPVVGASVVLRDVNSSLVWPADMPVAPPQIIEDISEAVLTDVMGRAELLPKGEPSPSALVEAAYNSSQTTYRSVANLSDAQNGVLKIELQQNWRLQGRIFLNGKPAVGAKVAVLESTRRNGPVQGGEAAHTTFSVQEAVVTDAEGRYRVDVPANKQYSVSIASLPGVMSDVSSVGHGATQIAEGVLEVRDLNFSTGADEIAGVVVDPTGAPLFGVSVSIHSSSAAEPDNWLGHSSESVMRTDTSGRFHLKKVPKGKYELRVSPPFTGGLRANPSLVDATTGDLHMRITIDPTPPPDIPRLHPQQIVDLPASSAQSASIRGRLMHDGNSLAGAKLGIVQADRRRVTSVTALETSTDDDGFFRFDGLAASQDYAIYTMLDQPVSGVLPVSFVNAPGNGQIAELGDIATQWAQSLTISVRTFDKSPLPGGGRVSVSRGRAWHTPRLDLPDEGSFQAEVMLPSVGKEMLGIAVRVPGYKILRTLPNLQRDWNHSYPLRFDGTMTLIVVLTPDQ